MLRGVDGYYQWHVWYIVRQSCSLFSINFQKKGFNKLLCKEIFLFIIVTVRKILKEKNENSGRKRKWIE